MKKIALSLLLLISIPTLASSATGTIGKVEMGPAYGHLVFISIIGSVSSQPTCHQNTSYNYVLDTSEAGQNATLSAILAAKASGQTVSISGYSQCVRYPDVEGLRWLRLEDQITQWASESRSHNRYLALYEKTNYHNPTSFIIYKLICNRLLWEGNSIGVRS